MNVQQGINTMCLFILCLDFAAGSRLGIVWHAMSKLINSNFTAVNRKVHHNLKDVSNCNNYSKIELY